MRVKWLVGALGLCLSACVVGCSSDDSSSGTGGSGAVGGAAGSAGTGGSAGAGGSGGSSGSSGSGALLDGDCDPLVPEYCSFPFPSNVWLKDDAGSPTGKRVNFKPASLPKSRSGTETSVDSLNRSDGFSAGTALMAYLPGATTAGLPTPLDIPRSITLDSPTLLIDAESGELVPHFSELDVGAKFPEDQAFMIRPAVRLKDGARYLVAIRNVLDSNGQAIAPSPAFKALRDDESSEEASVELRRELYGDIFQRLQSYTLKTGPWLEGDLALFPGALAGDHGALSWFGVEGSYGQAVGLDSERYAGETFDTSSHAYGVGLAARVPVRTHRVTAGVGYGRRVFEVEDTVPDNALYPAEPGVPSADYQFLRLGAGFEFQATRALTLITMLGYRAVLGEGDIAEDAWFPNASAGGIDFGMQLRYALTDALDVRAGFELERYFFKLNPEVGDARVAGGALDQYLSAYLGVGYAL